MRAATLNTVTVVTGDIVKSRLYEGRDRARLQKLLLDAWKHVAPRFPRKFASDFRFRITAGDEFQYVCKDFETALLSLTQLRIYARTSPLRPPVTMRASIATGTRNVKGSPDPYTQDGSAFRLAREGMEELHKQQGRLTHVLSSRRSADTVNLFLPVLDTVYAEWTPAQARVLLLVMRNMSRDHIAHRLRVSRPTVTIHLKRASWDAFEQALVGVRQLSENG